MHALEYTKNNFDDFILPVYRSEPYSQIKNRARMLDTANMLQAVQGIERIPFNGIYLVPNEYGPNGEAVWACDTQDLRIRFVGGWTFTKDGYGGYIGSSSLTTDYAEFSYWGTGLATLWTLNAGTWNIGLTVDNAVEVPVVVTSANTINNRGYKVNNPIVHASGQVQGWHYVKIRNTGAGLPFMNGVQILNETSDMKITAGQAFYGNKKIGLKVLSNEAYNEGVFASNGARVKKYVLDNEVGYVVKECPVSPSYLALADHTDEEEITRIPFGKWGANRADDFSTAGAAFTSRSYVMEDAGSSIICPSASLQFTDAITANVGSFISFGVKCSGFDIVTRGDGITRTVNVFIDGNPVSVGQIVTNTTHKGVRRMVVSGLPYCHHTIRLVNASGVDVTFGINEVILYQPKTAAIPAGAVEVAAFNVVANHQYIQNNNGDIIHYINKGLIRKSFVNEAFYSGASWAVTLDSQAAVNGWRASATTTGNYVEHYWWGTDFELRFDADTGGDPAAQITLDGSTNFSGYTTSVSVGQAGVSFTAATGILDTLTSAGVDRACILSVSGIPLGWHKIRITKSASGGTLKLVSFDYATPIDINHESLMIGSLSLMDNKRVKALSLVRSGLDAARESEFGYGQAWYNMTAFRTAGVVYYNTTKKPIIVQIEGSNGGNAYLYVDGALVSRGDYNSANVLGIAFVVVPPGSSYNSLSGSSITIWTEFR